MQYLLMFYEQHGANTALSDTRYIQKADRYTAKQEGVKYRSLIALQIFYVIVVD